MADLLIALGVVALGVLLLWGSAAIRFGAGYDRIGPRFFPYAVAGGLILLGSLLAFGAIRQQRVQQVAAEETATEPGLRWTPLGILGLALLLNLILLERAGFVIATSAQFVLVARAFDSKRPGRDAVVAVLLSTLLYIAFSWGLGLTLPPGVLERFFQAVFAMG